MNKLLEGHTFRRIDGDLAHLHHRALEMGGLVVDQMQRGVQAFDNKDSVAAAEVVARDSEVDRLDTLVDEEMIKVLALRQPVGTDLRATIIIARTVTDLERAGDQIGKVAELAERFYASGSNGPKPALLEDVHVLAAYSLEMLRKSMKAFDEFNIPAAVEVLRADARLEAKFQSSVRRLATFVMEDSRTVGHYTDIVLALRSIERIGSYAANIAGNIIYLCSGQDVRHLDLETIVNEVLELAPGPMQPAVKFHERRY